MTALSKKDPARLALLLLLSYLAPGQTSRAEQNFLSDGKNMGAFSGGQNSFVALNSGLAGIVSQKFALPRDTWNYPLVGLTVFPYYQSSPQLKEFLNSATIGGLPLNQFPLAAQPLQISLPATDLVNRSFFLPLSDQGQNRDGKVAVRDRRSKNEIPWMVAHTGGQAFALPSDTAGLALIAEGSMFAACRPRTMILRCGSLWILTGSRPAAVLTKHAAIAVKPYSIAAVEETWFDKIRIASLSGLPLELQLLSPGKTARKTVEKGRELTISAAPGGSSETAGSAENERAVLPAGGSVAGLSFSEKEISAKSCDFISRLAPVNPPISDLRMSAVYNKMFTEFGVSREMRRAEMQRRALEKYNLASRSAVNRVVSEPELGLSSSENRAAAQIFPRVQEELLKASFGRSTARYLAGTVLEKDEKVGFARLASGETIVVAEEPMQMRMGDCSVFARRGVVFNLVFRNGVAVARNIGESEAGSLKVRIKNRSYEIPVGSEIASAGIAPDLYQEMCNDGVARRNVHSIEADGGSLFISRSEVDLTSLMQYDPLMRKLYKSRLQSDQKLVQELMKMNVALKMVTGAGGYRRMSRLPSSR